MCVSEKVAKISSCAEQLDCITTTALHVEIYNIKKVQASISAVDERKQPT